jgi:hypothetical protein
MIGILALTAVSMPAASAQDIPIDLSPPFAPGATWKIIQGYDTDHTHGKDYRDERYALDLRLVRKDASGSYVDQIEATRGQPVLAAADGTVVFRDPDSGCVLLRHDQFTQRVSGGSRKYFFTMYCHLDSFSVGEHDKPKRGDKLGLAGQKGNATTPHIHFHLFSTVGYPTGQNSGGKTREEKFGVRLPEQLVRFRAKVLQDPTGKQDYAKDEWSADGTKDQYEGWIIADRASGPIGSAPTLNMLVLDVSGSMAGVDPSGKRKVEAAREAGLRLLRMLGRENERGATHRVGIVTFNEAARVLGAAGSEPADVERLLRSLSPQGGTNLSAGLLQAAQSLQSVGAGQRRILVLLSDGVPTVYQDGRPAGGSHELPVLENEVLERAGPSVAETADCVYVIGLGDPRQTEQGWPSLDEPFLRRIAGVKGCGGYYNPRTAEELANAYVRLRHELTGTLIAARGGTVAQGQTTPPFSFDVPADRGELHVSLNWPGSALDLLLVDPRGSAVDTSYRGASLFVEEPPAYAIIREPLAGGWQVQVRGANVPTGSTSYDLLASTRGVVAAPVAGASAALVFLMVLAALPVALVLFAGANRQPGSRARHASIAHVQITAPGQRPRLAAVRRLPFTVGRGAECDVLLDDSRVSRVHARVSLSNGTFVLEDLKSANGCYLNGQRVQRAPIRPQDELRIGFTTLRLQPLGSSVTPGRLSQNPPP